MKAVFSRIRVRTLAPALGVALAVGGFALAAPAASAQDNNEPLGEAAICYYDGKAYSEGAKIKLSDGTVQTCQKDGTWSSIRPAGPRLPVAPINGGVLARP
jgi:hypothetical protein